MVNHEIVKTTKTTKTTKTGFDDLNLFAIHVQGLITGQHFGNSSRTKGSIANY